MRLDSLIAPSASACFTPSVHWMLFKLHFSKLFNNSSNLRFNLFTRRENIHATFCSSLLTNKIGRYVSCSTLREISYLQIYDCDWATICVCVNCAFIRWSVSAEGRVWTGDDSVFSRALSQAELPRHSAAGVTKSRVKWWALKFSDCMRDRVLRSERVRLDNGAWSLLID